MQPNTVEITNIGPYEHEIITIPQGVTCITGKNGVGKSYIIDSILLALYGESSKGGEKELDNYRPDNGAPEGEVKHIFEHSGNIYQAEWKRNFAKSKTVSKLLINKEKDKWENVGGKGVKETKKAVENLVKLDFSASTNSYIVLQKDMESFANLTDLGRKEFYAQALRLGVYDQIDELERKKMDKSLKELAGIEKEIKTLEDTIACKEHFDSGKSQNTANITQVQSDITSAEAAINTLTERLAGRGAIEEKLRGCKTQEEGERKKVADLEARISVIRKAISHAEQKIAEQKKILSLEGDIEQACEIEESLAANIHEWNEKQCEHAKLKDTLMALERRQAEWEKAHAEEKTRLNKNQATWEQQQARERAQLETQIQQAQGQDALINEVPCVMDPEMSQQCKLLANAWKVRDGLGALQESLAQVNSRVSPHIPPLQELAAKISPYPPQIGEAQMDLDMCGYDGQAHETAHKQLAEIQKLSRMEDALAGAKQREAELQEQIGQSRTEITSLEQETEQAVARIVEISKEKAEYSTQLNDLSPLSFDLIQKQVDIKKLREREAELSVEKGKIETNLERIAKAEADLQRINEQTKDSRRLVQMGEMLRKACNKKGGVPALIIENSLPQIEAKTNLFLEGVQNGRFQIRFDTQPEVKSSGELSEGCKIVVMDNGRERPYKTYSGAEAFLLNFGLRIGNSLFLAHRAGAEIKFLVIDEGLGSLDQDNLQAVKEAIQRAADIFGKVLLITHIQELWDAFPQRIEVSRDGQGSKVKMIA